MPQRLLYLGTAAMSLQMPVGRFLKAAETCGVVPAFFLDHVGVYDENDVAAIGESVRAAQAEKEQARLDAASPRPTVTKTVERQLVVNGREVLNTRTVTPAPQPATEGQPAADAPAPLNP